MALKEFDVGEVLTADDVNTYLVNTLYAIKTVTESVVSSTTYQDDDHLSLAVEANSTYEFTCFLRYEADTAADLKYRFQGPAGAGIMANTVALSTAAAAVSDLKTVLIVDFTTDQASGGLGAGTQVSQAIHGIVATVGTAGTFKLQWAQFASSATDTLVYTSSYLVLRRVS